MVTRPELDNDNAYSSYPTPRQECLGDYINSGVIITGENYHRPVVRFLVTEGMVIQYWNCS